MVNEGIALLWLRVRAGETSPAVLGECLDAMLALDPGRAFPRVAALLDGPAHLSEAAAGALGASRLPDAFGVLRAWHERLADSGLERAALFALSSLRREESFAYLVGLIAEAGMPTAASAIEALAIHRGDDTLRRRVEEAVATRGLPRLRETLGRSFG